MTSERGSIAVPCLVAAVLLLLCSQLALLYAGRCYEREADFVREQQLRLLCGSIYSAREGIVQEPGEQLCYEGVLQPGNEAVRVTSTSSYSDDKLINYLQLTAQSANHTGAVQRLHKVQVNFDPELRNIAQNSVLAAVKLTGTEYLSQAGLYTSIEEVVLPQVSFLAGKCSNAFVKKTVEDEGLSTRFYYIKGNNTLTLGSSKGLKGQSLICNQTSVIVSANSQFPDRLVLISENGNITLGSNVKLAQALLLAKGTVTIGAGCTINGFVLANNIVLKGDATLTPDTSVVAPIATPVLTKL